MKNVTITVDEEVWRWARVWAAKNDTSVSRILGETLREKMAAEDAYEKARTRYLKRPAARLKAKGTRYPSRTSLHER